MKEQTNKIKKQQTQCFWADLMLPILRLEGGRYPSAQRPRPTPHNADLFFHANVNKCLFHTFLGPSSINHVIKYK